MEKTKMNQKDRSPPKRYYIDWIIRSSVKRWLQKVVWWCVILERGLCFFFNLSIVTGKWCAFSNGRVGSSMFFTGNGVCIFCIFNSRLIKSTDYFLEKGPGMVVDATRKAVQGTTSLQPETPVRKTQEMWDGFGWFRMVSHGFVDLWEPSCDILFFLGHVASCTVRCKKVIACDCCGMIFIDILPRRWFIPELCSALGGVGRDWFLGVTNCWTRLIFSFLKKFPTSMNCSTAPHWLCQTKVSTSSLSSFFQEVFQEVEKEIGVFGFLHVLEWCKWKQKQTIIINNT